MCHLYRLSIYFVPVRHLNGLLHSYAIVSAVGTFSLIPGFQNHLDDLGIIVDPDGQCTVPQPPADDHRHLSEGVGSLV